jgi:hypothetical protein
VSDSEKGLRDKSPNLRAQVPPSVVAKPPFSEIEIGGQPTARPRRDRLIFGLGRDTYGLVNLVIHLPVCMVIALSYQPEALGGPRGLRQSQSRDTYGTHPRGSSAERAKPNPRQRDVRSVETAAVKDAPRSVHG